jgi:cyclophilin family peptidyl-prolyl cis-trans isomerase
MVNQDKEFNAILHTEDGDIKIELFADSTPMTVSNFVSLARSDFYNGTVFHRVVNDFMIQGGDPNGNGTGGPGYSFPDEPFSGEYERGIIAMANSGPDTNGSQFFIMQRDVALSKDYVIFGKVTGGMNIVDMIAEAPAMPNPNIPGEISLPKNPTKIISVEIFEK